MATITKVGRDYLYVEFELHGPSRICKFRGRVSRNGVEGRSGYAALDTGSLRRYWVFCSEQMLRVAARDRLLKKINSELLRLGCDNEVTVVEADILRLTNALDALVK